MKNQSANLYNPHELTKQELIKTFVVRTELFNKLFDEIKKYDKYTHRHYVIEGQHGMGNTTLLLRLSYEIENDENLNKWLIPIVFKEESSVGTTLMQIQTTAGVATSAYPDIPDEGVLFKNGCEPSDPQGACMVSSEGACAAWYKYGK